MNIFILSTDPVEAAHFHADRHVLSAVREMAIMLRYVGSPPKPGYYHHKCSKWIRASQDNFDWAVKHFYALCEEYTYRYNKIHKNQLIIEEYLNNLDVQFFDKELTSFALAVTDDCKTDDPVQSYRKYYLTHKNHLLTYTRREIPEWIRKAGLGTWKEAKF